MMAMYNAERFIREAIDSVLRQTFQEFELLVVDDASTDSCVRIVRSYIDPRIRLIQNQTNRGVAATRERALEAAQGIYVAILDADDIARQDRLKIQVKFLDEHSDIGAVGSAFDVIDDVGRVQTSLQVLTSPSALRWHLLFGNCMANSATMFRREKAVKLGGYDKDMYACEDFELWTRFAAHSKISQVNLPLVQWRERAGSLSNSKPARLYKDCVAVVARSIQQQTGFSVDTEVAAALFRDSPKPAANIHALRGAYATIEDCLDFTISHQTPLPKEKRRLLSLAIADLFRLSAQNPGSHLTACRVAVRCIARHDPWHFCGPRCLRTLSFALMRQSLSGSINGVRKKLLCWL